MFPYGILSVTLGNCDIFPEKCRIGILSHINMMNIWSQNQRNSLFSQKRKQILPFLTLICKKLVFAYFFDENPQIGQALNNRGLN